LLQLAFAYGVALVAVIVALSGRHSAPAPASVVTPISMVSVGIVDLNLTRGGEAPRIALEPEAKLLVLSFLVDIHPGFHYAASLDGGPKLDVVSNDGKGNFALVVSRDVLGPGAHRLTVIEIESGSSKTERSIEFPFQL
jgi:hypothetical protein